MSWNTQDFWRCDSDVPTITSVDNVPSAAFLPALLSSSLFPAHFLTTHGLRFKFENTKVWCKAGKIIPSHLLGAGSGLTARCFVTINFFYLAPLLKSLDGKGEADMKCVCESVVCVFLWQRPRLCVWKQSSCAGSTAPSLWCNWSFVCVCDGSRFQVGFGGIFQSKFSFIQLPELTALSAFQFPCFYMLLLLFWNESMTPKCLWCAPSCIMYIVSDYKGVFTYGLHCWEAGWLCFKTQRWGLLPPPHTAETTICGFFFPFLPPLFYNLQVVLSPLCLFSFSLQRNKLWEQSEAKKNRATLIRWQMQKFALNL